MKKYLFISILSIFGLTTAHAQYNNDVEWGLFNHMSVGLGLGTTGISVDVAAPICPYVAVRAGADILPNINFHPALDLGFDQEIKDFVYEWFNERLPDKIDFDGKLKFTAGHLLVDVYPFKNSSFHVTAGAYLGGKQLVNMDTAGDQILLKTIYDYNHSEIREEWELGKIGVKLGNYFLEPDKNGVIKTSVEVNALRPYIGIGFGRAIPTKHRFACNFDLGFQFWGTPKVYLEGDNGKTQLEKSDLDPESAKALKKLSEAKFWPVLNVRCAYRIFKN
jgi:hypothetical protein